MHINDYSKSSTINHHLMILMKSQKGLLIHTKLGTNDDCTIRTDVGIFFNLINFFPKENKKNYGHHRGRFNGNREGYFRHSHK